MPSIDTAQRLRMGQLLIRHGAITPEQATTPATEPGDVSALLQGLSKDQLAAIVAAVKNTQPG